MINKIQEKIIKLGMFTYSVLIVLIISLLIVAKINIEYINIVLYIYLMIIILFLGWIWFNILYNVIYGR